MLHLQEIKFQNAFNLSKLDLGINFVNNLFIPNVYS